MDHLEHESTASANGPIAWTSDRIVDRRFRHQIGARDWRRRHQRDHDRDRGGPSMDSLKVGANGRCDLTTLAVAER